MPRVLRRLLQMFLNHHNFIKVAHINLVKKGNLKQLQEINILISNIKAVYLSIKNTQIKERHLSTALANLEKSHSQIIFKVKEKEEILIHLTLVVINRKIN